MPEDKDRAILLSFISRDTAVQRGGENFSKSFEVQHDIGAYILIGIADVKLCVNETVPVPSSDLAIANVC